jgi:FkbM family methyltransferase
MSLCQIEHHTFFVNGLSPTSTVLDLGANRGRFSQALIERFGAQCFAIEPNPFLFRQLPADSRLQTMNVAVAARGGTLPFYIADDSEASSLLEGVKSRATETVHVHVLTLSEVLNKFGLSRIDLMKIDVEGAEIGILESVPLELLANVGQITCEFHDFCELTPIADVERVIHRLRKLGFFFIPIWRRGYGDTLFVNPRVAPVSRLQRVWARHVTRNWWGLKRILARRRRKRL